MSREIFLASGNAGTFNTPQPLCGKCTPSVACGASSPGGGAKFLAASPSIEGGLGCFGGAAAGTQFSFLKSQFCFCNTVIVIYQKDFSTLPHMLFLRLQPLRRDTPLEMTVSGKRHLAEMGFVKCGPIPNSSFRAVVTCLMTVQTRIATASRSREIFLALGNTGLFNTTQPLCGKCTPSAFGSSHRHPPTRGEACHWILSRLRLPTNPVPLPPQAVPPPSKEGGLWVLWRRSRGNSNLNSQISNLSFQGPIRLYAHSATATRTKKSPHQGELFL